MDDLAEKIEGMMDTQEAQDAKTVLAYAIRRTKTLTDDEIVENVDDIVTEVADNIKDIAELKPTEQDAKDAVIRLLKSIASQTSNKWDDRAVKILDMFF